MRSRIPALVCTLICGMILYSAPLLAEQKTAFEVGSKSQLFIDHELVYEARGVSFTQHQGKKFSHEPLFVADQPCEGWAVKLYGTVMYDADEELFKMWYDGSASDYFSREVTFSSTSPDFVHWSKLEPALVADRWDDLGSRLRAERVRPLLNYRDNYNVKRTEIYGTGAYAAESCLLTFPWMFTVTANLTRVGNHEGPMEMQMAVSRDLIQWERPFRTPIIEPGRISKSEAEWDSGMFSTAAYGFDYRDEVWLYYYGANFTHGAPIPAEGPSAEEKKKYRSGVRLVTWKKDRFVSVDAAADEGVLTTIPFRFTGNRLEVNANVKPGGSLTFELLDIGLRPISGYPRSKPVAGESLKHVIEIGDQQDVSKLVGAPVVLQFRMKNAELYAFAFRK